MRVFILKEFYKFRFAFWIFVLAICFILAWIFFDIQTGIERFGALNFTLRVMYNKFFSFNHLDEVNIIFAVVIGALAMFAERANGRIRVQFSYPHTFVQNALMITLIPLSFVLLVYLVEFSVVLAILSTFFPKEISNVLFISLLYSQGFGVGAFLLTQSMIIDPNLKRVFANLCFLLGGAYIYFVFNSQNSAYYLNQNLWQYLAIFVLFGVLALIMSLLAYKQGYIK